VNGQQTTELYYFTNQLPTYSPVQSINMKKEQRECTALADNSGPFARKVQFVAVPEVEQLPASSPSSFQVVLEEVDTAAVVAIVLAAAASNCVAPYNLSTVWELRQEYLSPTFRGASLHIF